MAYLMDDISTGAAMVAQAGRNRDVVLRVFPDMAARIYSAPRFLLNNDAIGAAVELSLGRPKVLFEAMQHLQIPYPKMWVEWDETGRAELRKSFGIEDIDTPGRPVPARIGFLLEADTARSGTVTWVWSGGEAYGTKFPNVAPIVPHFDLDAQIAQPAERIRRFLNNNLVKIWEEHPAQVEALFALWRTADHRASRWGEGMFQALMQKGANWQEMIANAFADVYGEYICIWSILLLLTASRKAVDYVPVDRTRLNKHRVRKHEVPLLDHTSVIMHISAPAERPGAPGKPLDFQRKSPRIHLVSRYLARRGAKHWIVEPYMRGSGEMIHRRVSVRK